MGTSIRGICRMDAPDRLFKKNLDIPAFLTYISCD